MRAVPGSRVCDEIYPKLGKHDRPTLESAGKTRYTSTTTFFISLVDAPNGIRPVPVKSTMTPKPIPAVKPPLGPFDDVVKASFSFLPPPRSP